MERTVTFTMEDALMSPAGFMILSGAGLIEASETESIKVHTTEQTDDVAVDGTTVKVTLKNTPYSKDGENYIYVMLMKDGEVISEPYIPESVTGKVVTLKATDDVSVFTTGCVVLADYYTEKKSGAQQIDITPDKFGGNYYLEASTLFRDAATGVDMPAEFIIPNCKIQSNFSFQMSSSGDPSTFTFTMDAFPDYTRFNKTEKVLASIQVIETNANADISRTETKSKDSVDSDGKVIKTSVG